MFSKKRKIKRELYLEKTIFDDFAKDKDAELVEVPLGNGPLVLTGLAVSVMAAAVVAQTAYIGAVQSARYSIRAEDNQDLATWVQAPRGIIYDRNGEAIADNKPVFSASLKTDKFLRDAASQDKTLAAINEILGIPPEEIWNYLNGALENAGSVLLSSELSREEIIRLKSAALPAVNIESGFRRDYRDGEVFSSIVGYTGMVTASDLKNDSALLPQDKIGKSGAEFYYDNLLRGINGKIIQKRDAKGNLLGDKEETQPVAGQPLHLTIDAGLQKYFYGRMKDGLSQLGRAKGVGLAMDPRNGEVLAFLNFPVFDNNLLSSGGRNSEKYAILNSADQPLFNRAVSGVYSPGSTIKPLVGIAALKEGVITPGKEIFSPGYIDIPNPYKPDEPTRYLDWQYQGYVNLAYAIAQSSDVYFYEVGGGGPDSRGLGITRLRQWWQKFNLGNLTGIDMPGEAKGFLPSPEWKEKREGRPWLLGDSYNVSIGQGDLLLTPIQLLNYISAIANGGKMYRPAVTKNSEHKIISDLSELGPQIAEVRKGMRLVATSKRSMANTLGDLPFAVEGKTGTAQVKNNQQLNAFFVGYTVPDPPAGEAGEPQIAVLVLVENSREGSLNAVPIAKDVFNWYYWNRIKTMGAKLP